MEVRHLKLIEAVSEEGTLSKAGERLFLTQSALSHQLKELERELKTPLFHRVNKKLVLNESGRIMLESARKVLGEIEKAQKALEKQVNGGCGEIRLTTECYTCYHWLPRVMKSFSRQYPQIDISIFPEYTHRPIEGLLGANVDMMITTDDSDVPGVAYKELFRDEQLAVFPKGHPWTKKPYVSAKDFADETYIIYNGTVDTVDFFRSTLKPANAMPKKIIAIELTEATIEMINAGYGVKAMSTWVVKPYLQTHEIEVVPITKNGHYRTWYIAHLKDRTWYPYYDQFLSQLVSILRGID